MRGIAANKILEHHRANAVRGRIVQLFTPEILRGIADRHEKLMSAAGDTFLDRLAPLRECLENLASADREIVERHYHRKQSCGTIAAPLGTKLEAVKKRLQRARAELKVCILAKLKLEPSRG